MLKGHDTGDCTVMLAKHKGVDQRSEVQQCGCCSLLAAVLITDTRAY